MGWKLSSKIRKRGLLNLNHLNILKCFIVVLHRPAILILIYGSGSQQKSMLIKYTNDKSDEGANCKVKMVTLSNLSSHLERVPLNKVHTNTSKQSRIGVHSASSEWKPYGHEEQPTDFVVTQDFGKSSVLLDV